MARKCEVCGEKDARYICDSCGRSVCGDCLDPQRWVCTMCLSETTGHKAGFTWALAGYNQSWLLLFLIIGFITVFIGMMLMMVAALFSGVEQVSGGAVFFIGPIPIILGYGPFSTLFLFLAVILSVVGALFFFGARKKSTQDT